MNLDERAREWREKIRQGGTPEKHAWHEGQGKMFVRDRLKLLLDPGYELEEWIFARCLEEGKPGDGVVTLVGKIGGRPVAVMANDMTVKAGTWGTKTIEKIMRIQEVALKSEIPMIYLVDSGAARLDEQFDIFLDRRHAGKIFWWMSKMNGVVPQICVNFGPSPAGSAYLPAFCDLVVMVEGHASVYLGSPRMAEMVTGEKVTHDEMGGAHMHCEVSGLGDCLARDEVHALELVKGYLSYLPDNWKKLSDAVPPVDPAPGRPLGEVVPENQGQPFDMHEVVHRLIDADSWYEMKELYAPELITGFARLNGRAVGIVANNSTVKGGVLYANSAEKGAQFISTCTAFNLPLIFLMDVPGFMIGSQVERTGIIRRGQKMLQAVAEATQPRISVIIRKAYGAGYMAMSGATFQPNCVIALPQAQLAVMGPEAAVNAIYAKKLEEITDPKERMRFVYEKRKEYQKDIAVWRPASEMYVDDVVPSEELRAQLIQRLELYCRHYDHRNQLSERRTRIMRG